MANDTTARALQHAARRALSIVAVLPSTFRAAVTVVEEDRQQYRRTAYLIDSRHVRLRTRAASGSRKSEIGLCPDPRSVDPWKVDPSLLPAQSQAVTVCPSCGGEKKIACGTCRSSGLLACGNCGGGGRVMGQRGPKNCPSCRGKGTRRCDGCHGRGQVKCSTCEGLGRVRAWLEIEKGRRLEIKAHPKIGIALLHPELETGGDLDRDPDLLPVPLISDTGWGTGLPAGLGAELLPIFDAHSDRIASRRLQVFESTVHHCRYRLVTGSATVQVSARPLEILEESDWTPWRRRLALALGTGATVMVSAIAYLRSFTSRAEWFAQHTSADLIMPLGLLSAIFATMTAAGMCLPRPAWGWLRVRLPALAVVGLWTWMWLLWLGVQPSVEGAHASIERGDLEAAHREIGALEVVGVDDPESLATVVDALRATEAERDRQRRRSLDEEHLASVERADTTQRAVAQLESPWEYEDSRESAKGMVLEHAHAEADELFERRDGRGLRELADTIAPYGSDLAARARSRQRLCEAHACSTNGEWRCAVTALVKIEPVDGDEEIEKALARARNEAREGLTTRLSQDLDGPSMSLEQEKEVLQQRLADARAYTELTEDDPPISAHQIEKRLVALERKLQKQRKKDETRRLREERRAARAAKRTKEREAQAAARAVRRADRVWCCDGTTSPSCRYSQGSLRGCCSWHGGVC